NDHDIQRYTSHRATLMQVPSFIYGTGSHYSKGSLGHDDVLNMVPQLITERPLMRRLIASQFPFLFVDESQDTTENVVNSLRILSREASNRFCVGFFGDPMQRIYPTGIGSISPEPNWVTIKKAENFRCARTVLNVANAIRVPADNLEQTR